jgi:hypothetical protein
VLALALHLDGGLPADPATWEESAEVRGASVASVEAWTAAVTASGTASAEELAAATEAARAQFTPQG